MPPVPHRWSSALNGSPRRVAGRLAAAGASLALSGCKGGILDPQGPIGDAERTILFDALAIMLAIGIPTIVATLAFAWWFRASNTRARYRPDWVYSGRVELLVWSIPTLVIVFLGGVIWIGSHDLDPGKPLQSQNKPLEVQVVSLDWKWLFIYPTQGVASVNELVAPVGTPLHFTITSASVMNAFFVPQLGGMIYAMNGMATRINLQADHPGEYLGLSAHFSGDGFPGMRFTLRAVAPDAFDAWAAGARSAGPALDRTSYTQLAKQSADVAPMTYRSVEPDLFQAIATQALPPGPGPAEGEPTPSIPQPAGD
jgi:cytochrome o ubiquinol oxidase subunit 2